MPRVPSINERMNLAVAPESKARIIKAAALMNMGMTEFVIRTAEREAHDVIERQERLALSDRDMQLMLELLDNPPAPNARLKAVARDLPSLR